ncbi:uncharacterized protein LOC143195674 isoform X3 [Rhynchophorus ferrugineus]|uniref:Uncharacterized protein n=1 Tax=Rhynchophorus ferrugineus TaxID=354439 RepID=A0A834IGJ2_RHYFE|nr:hypothetical protein GWI33_008112 [Rhynchophorus ferrugineus]
MVIKFGFVTLCLLAAILPPPTKAQQYQISKYDVSDPACKYVLSEIIRFDRHLLDLSSLFPTFSSMADKYTTDDRFKRKKRNMPSLLSKFDNEFLGIFYDHVDRILEHAEPCFYWVRGFLKFWLHKVVFSIFADQIHGFLT